MDNSLLVAFFFYLYNLRREKDFGKEIFMKIPKVLIILFVVAIIAIGGYFLFVQKNSQTSQQKFLVIQ